MSRTRTSRTPPAAKGRSVSRPHDPAEMQADKAADVVAHGGSVSGWSFGSVPLEAGVHRDGPDTKSNDDKLKEGAGKLPEALLKTDPGKKLQDTIKADPLVKKATEFLDTTTGKVVAGGLAAGGVVGLAAAKQPLPFQAPAIPLDKITPGLSAQVTVQGPLNAPTFAGLSLTYKEQGPKGKKGPTDQERVAADAARLRGLDQMFKPQSQKDQEKADEQAAVAQYIASQQRRFGVSTLLPLTPGDQPKTVEQPPIGPAEPPKDKDDKPVQREPATATQSEPESALDTSGVDDAVRGGGRPLDESTRRSMETRFGYDFSGVRLHDDARAAAAASAVDARAFTLGEDVVLANGQGDVTTPQGRHLLAHELAHVVQQQGTDGVQRLQRRSIFESVGILLGLAEGTWSDTELRAYLDAITKAGHFDGAYDADNKARAIVRKWKAGEPGWDLLGVQKALLIDEMIDGPTLGEDEECILDLLENSDAGDLRVIFAKAQERTLSLEDNLQGDNRTRLDAFEASRFRGGRTELLAGRVVVIGHIAAGAPSPAFDSATFDARLDSDRTADELIAIIDRFSPADRTKAIDHLLHEVWVRQRDEAGRSELERRHQPGDAAVVGRADAATKQKLKTEQVLSHYFPHQSSPAPDALETATKPVDAARLQELRDVLRPKQYTTLANDESKLKAKQFDSAKYRADVEKALIETIDGDYNRRVVNAGTKASGDEMAPMATLAQTETDKVFAGYYASNRGRAALRFDKPAQGGEDAVAGNVHVLFDKAKGEFNAMGPQLRREAAKEKILYYFGARRVFRDINDAHGVNPTIAPVDKVAERPKMKSAKDPNQTAGDILNEVADTLTDVKSVSDEHTELGDKDTENVNVITKILRAERNWSGLTEGLDISVNMFHGATVEEDRLNSWLAFQNLIHEYLHTLVSGKYDDYADSFGSSAERNTLREGMDSLLDEVVWAHVLPHINEPPVRRVVEGDTWSELPPMDVPAPLRYPSYTEALALVEKVGIQNVYAAYFLGLVDRISVALPEAKEPSKKAGAKP